MGRRRVASLTSLVACGALVPLAASCSFVVDVGRLDREAGGAVSGAGDAAPDVATVDASEDGGGVRFCERASPRPTFCADFEDAEFRFGWENAKAFPDPFVSGGARLEATTPTRDGTRGVTATLPPSIDARQAAYLFKGFRIPAMMHVAVEMSVEGDPPDGERVTVLAVTFESDAAVVVGTVSVAYDHKNGLHIGVSPPEALPAVGRFEPSPAGRGFRRLELVLDLDATASRPSVAELYSEGSRVVKQDVPQALARAVKAYLILGGVRSAPMSTEVRVTVDNVTVDIP